MHTGPPPPKKDRMSFPPVVADFGAMIAIMRLRRGGCRDRRWAGDQTRSRRDVRRDHESRHGRGRHRGPPVAVPLQSRSMSSASRTRVVPVFQGYQTWKAGQRAPSSRLSILYPISLRQSCMIPPLRHAGINTPSATSQQVPRTGRR
jgi:hypothetical protein